MRHCNAINKGGIRIGNFEGLRKYVIKALQRCGSKLEESRIIEIENFIMDKFWLQGKNIPTRVGKKKDPAVRWALREKLKDVHFQNHTVSTIQNEDGEEVDIFELLGENDGRYEEIEQWHDICRTVGPQPARALLFGLYDSLEQENEQADEEEEREKEKWKSRQGVLF